MIQDNDTNGAGVIRSVNLRSLAKTPVTERWAITYNCAYLPEV